MRQDFFYLGTILSYYDLDFILEDKSAYRTLPFQSSQQILKLIYRNWKSYFNSLRIWKQNSNKLKKRPKLPRYKKKNGEVIKIFTNLQCKIKKGHLFFPKRINLEPIRIRIKDKLSEVLVIPLGGSYKLKIVYEKEIRDLGLNKEDI